MMAKSRMFVVGLVILAGSFGGWIDQVHAAIHEGTDVLGLATTPDESGEFSLTDPPLGAIDVHLLVYGFDHAQGIVGWECQVLLPSGVQATGITLNGKADPAGVDLATGNMQVFPLIPLVANNGIVHLATIHLMLTDRVGNKDFLLAPYSAPTPNATMDFSLETSGSNMFAFNWPGQCSDCPVFTIITSPEPTVETSWDLVKSLYH